MKKTLLLIMLILIFTPGLTAQRIDFNLNGIDYQVISETAKTCKTIKANVSGEISIPANVQGYNVVSIGVKTFANCEELISVVIPNTVTQIEFCAFYESSIQSVVIPNSVTEIGEESFSYCSFLSSVDIPDSVIRIGRNAFSYCSRLESVNISNSVTTIEYGTFGRCKKLESVNIPNSVTSIDREAFLYCSNLTSVNIPNSVTSIGYRAFCGCKNLTSIDIPNSVTSIFDEVFAGCINLVSIEIPNSITKIGGGTFANCEKLKSVSIPSSVTTIGGDAFKLCKNLTNVVIPASVTEIGIGAFEGCINMTSVRILSENPPSVGKESFEDFVVKYVPSSSAKIYRAKWSDVSHIIGFETQKKLDIRLAEPGSLINDFMNLSEDDIPQITVLKISGDMNGTDFLTLNKMVNIIELDLSDANIVSGGMDYYTSDNQKYRTNNNVFKRYQLNGLKAIQTLVMPKSLKSIDDYAFKSYKSLRSVTLGNSIATIGEGAFEGSGLISVIIPNSVTRIDGYAFTYCYLLKSIILSNSITRISESSFEYCESLTSVTIPDKVTTISNRAFYWCENLETITMPNAVKSIGSYAFYGCSSLSSIIIPKSLTKITAYTFYGCKSLTSITIPSSVTEISDGAFGGCNGLAAVYCLNTTPPSIDNTSFSNYDIPLYIPIGSKTSYWLHPVWCQFHLEEFDFAGVGEVSVETELQPTDYYNLYGIKVTTVAPGEQPHGLSAGIYITKCGTKTNKILLK